MQTMTVSEAQAEFVQLLNLIAAGEEVELLQDQQPVARVVPVKHRVIVGLAGSVVEDEDLVSPTSAVWEAAS